MLNVHNNFDLPNYNTTKLAIMQKLDIKMTQRPKCVKRRFDFEVGYLAQSPCRNCLCRSRLPRCSEKCKTLNSLQDLLAPSLSCSRFKE